MMSFQWIKAEKDIDLVSIVIPFFNEEQTLRSLHDAIGTVMASTGLAYEILFVNDGSTDNSETECRAILDENPTVKLINFRRNFGKSAALSAGFREAAGDIVITMDADLQDDPNELPRFLDAIRGNVDVVCGWKKVRHDPLVKTFPSRIFNAVVNSVFGLSLKDHNCGFKAYKAEALRTLNLYGELHRFVPALLHARGYRIAEMPVQHHPRRFGVSKFGTERLVKGALDMMTVALTTRYGARPLHIFGAVGLFSMALGTLSLAYLSVFWLLGMGPIGNRPLLFFGILATLFGGQLIGTGLIAELMLSRSMNEDSKYDVRSRIDGNRPAS